MKRALAHICAGALLATGATVAWAQPADLPIPPATTTQLPSGISINRALPVPVYTDAKGRTLYGLDMRTVLRWAPDAAFYCAADCLKLWQPVLAPKGMVPDIGFPDAPGHDAKAMIDNRKAPDWTVIRGPMGPQWVYKGWHMVFIRKGERPGSTAFEGAEGLTWNTLKYLPPPPQVVAPPGVSALYADGGYLLADAAGRPLFTGSCKDPCTGWTPLAAALASQGIGKWKVQASGDEPQWTFAGQPVFVGAMGRSLPPGATALRP